MDCIVNGGFGTYKPRSIWRDPEEWEPAGPAARQKVDPTETREWNDLLDLIGRTLSDRFPEAMQALGDAYMDFIRQKRRMHGYQPA
jgi:hypothetical protein